MDQYQNIHEIQFLFYFYEFIMNLSFKNASKITIQLSLKTSFKTFLNIPEYFLCIKIIPKKFLMLKIF